MTSVKEIFETMEYGPAPESDAEARKWLASHGGQFGHFIGGAWTSPGEAFEVIDPSTAAVLARVTQGTRSDVDARSEEHTSEFLSRLHLVCRLLFEKKKKTE